jgi:hypothetical protein
VDLAQVLEREKHVALGFKGEKHEETGHLVDRHCAVGVALRGERDHRAEEIHAETLEGFVGHGGDGSVE